MPEQIITETLRSTELTVPDGTTLVAPDGHHLTLTVDGVHRDLEPGTYTGDVVLSVTETNQVDFDFMGIEYTNHLTQAVYVDAAGLVPAKSVLAATPGVTVEDGVISGVDVTSKGALLDGVYVAGGQYLIQDAVLDLEGDGGDDFTGYGAAIAVAGKGTKATIDGARIRTRGVVRTGVVAHQGADLVVKHSDVRASEGVLPADYVPNPEFGTMKCVPWMLGLDGNCRAFQLIGDHGTFAFVDSYLQAEKWGVLSNDISAGATLVTVDSTVVIAGDSGYGVYNLGGAKHRHYGTEIRVRDVGFIMDEGGTPEEGGDWILIGDATPKTLSALNEELSLGLTEAELAALPSRPTKVTSDRFGFLIHVSIAVESPASEVHLTGHTTIETGKAVFLIKGVAARIAVGKDVRLESGSNVIAQVIDSDDPGPRIVDGRMANSGVFREKQERPAKVPGFDLGEQHDRDVYLAFDGTTVVGDFYNGWRDGTGPQRMGGEGGVAPEPEPGGKNLVVALDSARLTGVVTSAWSTHTKAEIGAEDWRLLGEVTNVPEPAVNNGAILTLSNSTWTVTGPSYLTALTLDESSAIVANDGKATLTVDGIEIPIAPGTYRGAILVSSK